jgi:hypothetical protein
MRSISGLLAGAVDLGDEIPYWTPAACRLPIGDMAGEEDHPPPGRDRLIHMFEAARLDGPPGCSKTHFPKVRVGHDPAEIVPHAGDHARDFGLETSGEGARLGCAEHVWRRPRGANAARQRAPPGAEAHARQQFECAGTKAPAPTPQDDRRTEAPQQQ